MLCAPAVIAMLLVTAYPIGYAIVLSLQDLDLRFPEEGGFAGLDNYEAVLTSRAVVAGPLQHRVRDRDLGRDRARARDGDRAGHVPGDLRARGGPDSVLIPYGIVTVVAAFAWQFAFAPDIGFVNNLPLIADDKAWFGDRFSSFAVIIMAEVWKTTPFMALLLLAGLTTIDDGLYEAAKVDGATPVQRFLRITLPLMKPAILVALLFRTLDAFRIFDTIFIMTRGAQDTESVSILGYNQLIARLNLGLGSAVSVLIFFCVLIIAFLFIRGFGVRMAEGRPEGRLMERGTREYALWSDRDPADPALRAVPGGLDHLAVAQGARDDHRGHEFRQHASFPRTSRSTTTRRCSRAGSTTARSSAADQLDPDRPDLDRRSRSCWRRSPPTRSPASTSRASR